MDVTIVIGTYGAPAWIDLARSRAIPSAQRLGVPVIHTHAGTLQDARNAGLMEVETEWVCHLDADDELDSDYIDALAQGDADLRAPSVAYVRNGRRRPPAVPRVAGHTHDCTAQCLADGNWLVIGTAVRTQLLRDVGGWRDWPLYEDWDAFTRCWLAGATIEAIPQAIYVAHVRFDSRNRAPSIEFKNQVHRKIVAANFPVAA